MNEKLKLVCNLLGIVEKQDEIICQQKQTIYQLVNENAEKENMINELIQQEGYLY